MTFTEKRQGMSFEEMKNQIIGRFDFSKFKEFPEEQLMQHAARALNAAIAGTKDTCGDVVRVTFPFLAVARRAVLRGPGVPPERLGKIGLYLNLFYAPYFCRCVAMEEEPRRD